MINVNEKQVGGQHYKVQGIQHWDYVLANRVPYMEAQILRYVGRHRLKGGGSDLRKAQHFIEKLVSWENERPHSIFAEEPEHPPHFADWVRSCVGPEFNLTLDEIECMRLVRFWHRGYGAAWLLAAHRIIDAIIAAEQEGAADPQPHGYTDQG